MKQDNKKLILYIVFALLAVALCYLFFVVFFFYIKPYDISLKLAFWPFQSDKSLSELYMDSVVEIEYNIKGEFEDSQTIYLTGVNVRKDGFIVCPYHKLSAMQDTSILSVKDNKGNVYDGKLLYSEQNLDLAIIKCDAQIPFVKFGEASDSVLVVNSPLSEGVKYAKSNVIDICYAPFLTLKDEFVAVDYVWEECAAISYNENILDGVVFDRDAHVLGFSCPDIFSYGAQDVNVFLPISNVSLFFDNVVEKYYNDLVYEVPMADLFVGLDRIELEFNYDISKNLQEEDYNNNESNFLFQGQWQPYTDDIVNFIHGDYEGFFLLQPFVYKDVRIEPNKMIYAVYINAKRIAIYTRYDLFNAIYNIKSGDEIKISFSGNFNEGIGNIQFTYLEEEDEEI